MTAIIRQQYIDPHLRIPRVREMGVDVEIMRTDGTFTLDSTVQLKVYPQPLPHHLHEPDTDFNPVFISPDDLLGILIDGKRTSNPSGCKRTRLLKPIKNYWEIIVEAVELLDARIGDPVVVLSEVTDTSDRVYGLISSIKENMLTLNVVDHEQKPFFKGAIVENLANRWYNDANIIGAKSQLIQPAHSAFSAKRIDAGRVSLKLQPPINSDRILYHDIYIRNHHFNNLKRHWIPDMADLVPASLSEFHLNTYNGGVDASGGLIGDYKGDLFAAVIIKDKEGFYDANESKCFVKIIN